MMILVRGAYPVETPFVRGIQPGKPGEHVMWTSQRAVGYEDVEVLGSLLRYTLDVYLEDRGNFLLRRTTR